jgi:hypothetical protein
MADRMKKPNPFAKPAPGKPGAKPGKPGAKPAPGKPFPPKKK